MGALPRDAGSANPTQESAARGHELGGPSIPAHAPDEGGAGVEPRRAGHAAHDVPPRQDRRADLHTIRGPQRQDHSSWVTERADLGDRLLAEEAALGEVDGVLETGLRRQRVLVDVDREPRPPAEDPPAVERLWRDPDASPVAQQGRDG